MIEPLRPEIRPDDLSDAAVHDLLGEHLRDMALHSPPESVHALDLSGLRVPEISFWTVWGSAADDVAAQNSILMGCGALKKLSGTEGEIKSMRTAVAHRRCGAGKAMLTHILAEARSRGYRRLSLETGTAEVFRPAHALYSAAGFTLCGPFANYVADPHSVFMTLRL